MREVNAIRARAAVEERLQMPWEQVLAKTQSLSVLNAAAELEVDSRFVSSERKRLGLVRPSATETMRAERQQLATQHGFDSWEQVLSATIECTKDQVAQAFGLTPSIIYADRVRYQVQEKSVPITFQAADPTNRYHGTRGYRRGCRCLKCRSGWAQALRIRRQVNAAHPQQHTHGVSGYTNHRCRCAVCVEAWTSYKIDYARRKAA